MGRQLFLIVLIFLSACHWWDDDAYEIQNKTSNHVVWVKANYSSTGPDSGTIRYYDWQEQIEWANLEMRNFCRISKKNYQIRAKKYGAGYVDTKGRGIVKVPAITVNFICI